MKLYSRKTGEAWPAWVIFFLLLDMGTALGFALPPLLSEATEALALHSACWRHQEGPPAGRLFGQYLDSATHCPPLAPQLHAHQPHLPEDKDLHCLYRLLPGPSPPLASMRLLEEGKTHFLLLVLTP